MRKLGLVGGMGPESTIPYYHGIVYGVQRALGKPVFPELSIESINLFEILWLCQEKRHDELVERLLKAIDNLARSGADFAALSANTPHIVFDKLQERSPIPLISIVEAACKEAGHRGLKKIGLLGTIFTMTGDFFKAPFLKSGIQVVVPQEKELPLISDRITKELELGIVKDETLAYFQRVIAGMQSADGIEAIVLGCTELPLVLNDEVSPLPCLDTMQIHINALIKAILGEC